MYGVVLITTLVVVGGAIAVIGDRVGSKVGKKKLSLFGLRPRHTSVIVTIITGVLITTLTFAVLAAVSENVRVALFGMEKLNEEMKNAEARLDETGEKLAAAEKAHKAARDALAKSQGEVDELQNEQAELEARTQELTRAREALEAAKESLTEQNETLEAQNDSLSEENKALEKNAEDLRNGLIIMREGEIAFRAGEVLASGVVKGGRENEETRADLGALIQLANANAAERLGGNRDEGYVWIYTPEYEAAAASISSSDRDMVVRIVAAGNLLRGEPVRTALELFPNRIIYDKGEFILSREYSFTGSQKGEAEAIVMRFLQDVNARARERGILPDPIRGSVGIMESSQFYEIVGVISKINGDFTLFAYAREDTDSMGPLRLSLTAKAAGEK